MADSPPPSAVTVEFIGLAEHRAGCRQSHFCASSLSDLRQQLCRSYPQFAEAVEEGEISLARAWILNVNGDRFVGSRDLPLQAGDTVLVLSVDAGG